MLLKIGELAKRTGLTVRTLHHYDAIKLLCPSGRSDAGYRLYNRADIERLYRIQALRRLDLALAEIAALLERDGADLKPVIEQQIVQLEREAARAIELRDRLKLLLGRLSENSEPDLPYWLSTLEMMAMYDKYFTREELATMRALTEQLGKDITTQANLLAARIRDLMDRGVPAASDEAQALSQPWMALVNARMGEDMRLIQKLDAMHRNEPMVQALSGVDGAMIDYMAQAFLEMRLKIYAKYLGEHEMQSMRANFGTYRLQWMELASEMREQMDRDPDPRSPRAQEICARWRKISHAVWGPDPAVHERVRRAHQSEPELLVGTGVSQEMVAFLQQGIGHLIEKQANKNEAPHA